jgi:tetratricopeptide (TPR) repeat protein
LVKPLGRGIIIKSIKYIFVIYLCTTLWASPIDAENDYHKGYRYFSKGLYSEAINHYKHAVSEDPLQAKYHVWLGRSYLNLGQTKNALAELEKTLEIDPGNHTALVILEEDYGKTANPAEGFYRLGYATFEAADYQKAADYFQKAIDIDIEQAKYHLWLSRCYLELKQPVEAYDSLKKTVVLDAHNVSAVVLLMEHFTKEYPSHDEIKSTEQKLKQIRLTRLKKEKQRQAKEIYKQAIHAYVSGNIEESIQLLKSAKHLDNAEPLYQVWQSRFQQEKDSKQLSVSITNEILANKREQGFKSETYHEVLYNGQVFNKRDSEDIKNNLQLGLVYLKLGRNNKAQQYLKKAYDLNPTSNLLGPIKELLDTNDPSQLTKTKLAETYYHLALKELIVEKYPSAILLFKKALSWKEQPQTLTWLAHTFKKMDQTNKQNQYIEYALDMDPQFEPALLLSRAQSTSISPEKKLGLANRFKSLGVQSLFSKKYENAVLFFELAAKSDPDRFTHKLWVARTYLLLDLVEKCKEIKNELSSFAPFNRGVTFIKRDLNTTDDQKDMFNKQLLSEANHLADKKEYEEAYYYFLRAQQIQSDKKTLKAIASMKQQLNQSNFWDESN